MTSPFLTRSIRHSACTRPSPSDPCARRACLGFTLTEMIIVTAVTALVFSGVMAAVIHVTRSELRQTFEMEMLAESHQVAAFLRSTTRVSSLSQMVLHPEGGPHIAISYPVPARPGDDGNEVLDAEGYLVWGETLILHPWPPDDPEELRITRFTPRDNTLSEAQRLEQIAHVTQTGGGTGTFNGANSTTRTLARLEPEFSLRTGSDAYNFYAPTESGDTAVNMGGVKLVSGENIIRFKAADKSPASGGYGLIIDRINISPAGIPIEAEALWPVTWQYGAAAAVAERVAGGWSDRQALSFPAVSAGAELELTFFNDTWHETLFLSPGSDFDRCFTFRSNEPGNLSTQLRSIGRDPAWIASFQTGSDGEGRDDDMAMGAAVRVVVRGSQALGGMHVLADGDGCTVVFRASNEPSTSLHILHAFISEAADHTYPGPDVAPDTTTRLRFGSPDDPLNGVRIARGQSERTVPADFPIDPEKSYVISYLVADEASGTDRPGNPWIWSRGDDSGVMDTHLIPSASSPTLPITRSGVWSSRSDVESMPAILAVESIQTTYANKASYTSRVVDTTLTNPDYKDLSWEGTTPDETAIEFRVRSGDHPDMSDAAEWDSVSALTQPGPIAVGSGRYVQVRATLIRDKIHDQAPELGHFTLRWIGEPARVDFGGIFHRYPQGGLVEVLVNDEPPASAFRAVLKVGGRAWQGARDRDWRIAVETTPRN